MLPDYYAATALQLSRLSETSAVEQNRSGGRHSVVERADLAIEVSLHRLRDRLRNRSSVGRHRLRLVHH